MLVYGFYLRVNCMSFLIPHFNSVGSTGMVRLTLIITFITLTFPVYAAAKKTKNGLNVRAAYHRSYTYEKTQDYGNAIKSILLVYRKYPNGYTVNLRLGWLFYLKGAYANSLQHYQKAVKTLPSSITPRLGYTLPLIAQKKWTAVEQTLNQILKVDFYNYTANLRLSYILRMQKKFDLAEKVIKKMLAFYPSDIALLGELALIYQAKGNLKGTENLYRDILILDPENTAARAFLQ